MFQLSHLVKSVVKFDIKCVFTHQGSLVCSANSVTRVFDGVFCKIQNLPCCTHKGKRKCQFPTKTSNTKKYENQSKLKINFKILNLIFFFKKWIKSWNGGSNYLAEWIAFDNYIDGTSVCGNHRRGSIDYRECRKAAKQHFHEQCRTWRARFDGDRKDHSERMRIRYCGAASSFSPMG